jgi:multisubunit Na+/H+ antiporter MnhG subunit
VSAHLLALDVLVGLGVAVELLCCAGVLAARTAIDKLHYAAAAATLGPAFVAAAIVLQESLLTSGGLNAVVVALLLLVLGSAATTFTARAFRLRERGTLEASEAERRRGA